MRYVLDQYKTPKMCDKAILDNGETVKSVPATKIKKSVTKQLIIILMH